MAFVALRQLNMGDGRTLQPGDPVPEAEDWPNQRVWLEEGYISGISDEELELHAQAIEATEKMNKELAKAEKAKAVEPEKAAEPEPEPEAPKTRATRKPAAAKKTTAKKTTARRSKKAT